jgi:hypothetical protein
VVKFRIEVQEDIMVESVFVLNDIEKKAAEDLILKMDSDSVPLKKQTNNTNDIHSEISYEYLSTKEEKAIRGRILDCRYKLRYRGANRVFFSAWDCKDACSIFYDALAVIHAMTGMDFNLKNVHIPFTIDLNMDGYVYLTGEIAESFVNMAKYLNNSGGENKVAYNSQYLFFVFTESEPGEYAALIEKCKAGGSSHIQVFQVWIRGEILYYVLADGAILRPGPQRDLSSKEEEDIVRKIYKSANELSRSVDFK